MSTLNVICCPRMDWPRESSEYSYKPKFHLACHVDSTRHVRRV